MNNKKNQKILHTSFPNPQRHHHSMVNLNSLHNDIRLDIGAIRQTDFHLQNSISTTRQKIMSICCTDNKSDNSLVLTPQHFSMQKRTNNIRINTSGLQKTKVRKALPPQPIINQVRKKSSVTGQQNHQNMEIKYDRAQMKSINNPKINHNEARNKHQQQIFGLNRVISQKNNQIRELQNAVFNLENSRKQYNIDTFCGQCQRLKGILIDLQRQNKVLKMSSSQSQEWKSRIHMLESQKERLTLASEQMSQTIRSLRQSYPKHNTQIYSLQQQINRIKLENEKLRQSLELSSRQLSQKQQINQQIEQYRSSLDELEYYRSQNSRYQFEIKNTQRTIENMKSLIDRLSQQNQNYVSELHRQAQQSHTLTEQVHTKAIQYQNRCDDYEQKIKDVYKKLEDAEGYIERHINTEKNLKQELQLAMQNNRIMLDDNNLLKTQISRIQHALKAQKEESQTFNYQINLMVHRVIESGYKSQQLVDQNHSHPISYLENYIESSLNRIDQLSCFVQEAEQMKQLNISLEGRLKSSQQLRLKLKSNETMKRQIQLLKQQNERLQILAREVEILKTQIDKLYRFRSEAENLKKELQAVFHQKEELIQEIKSLSSLNQEVSILRNSISLLNQKNQQLSLEVLQVDSLKRQVNSLSTVARQADSMRKSVTGKESEALKIAKDKLTRAFEQADHLKRQNEHYSVLARDTHDLKLEVERLSRFAKETQTLRSQIDRLTSIVSEGEQLKHQNKRLKTLAHENQSLRQQINNLSEIVSETETLRKQIEELSAGTEQIQKLKVTNSRISNSVYQTILSRRKNQPTVEIESEIEYLRNQNQRLSTLANQNKRLGNEINRAIKQIDSLRQDNQRLRSSSKELQTLRKSVTGLTQVAKQAKVINQHVNQLPLNQDQTLKAANQKLSEVLRQVDDLQRQNEEFAQINVEYETLKAEIKSLSKVANEINLLEREIDRLSTLLNDREKLKRQHQRSLEQIEGMSNQINRLSFELERVNQAQVYLKHENQELSIKLLEVQSLRRQISLLSSVVQASQKVQSSVRLLPNTGRQYEDIMIANQRLSKALMQAEQLRKENESLSVLEESSNRRIVNILKETQNLRKQIDRLTTLLNEQQCWKRQNIRLCKIIEQLQAGRQSNQDIMRQQDIRRQNDYIQRLQVENQCLKKQLQTLTCSLQKLQSHNRIMAEDKVDESVDSRMKIQELENDVVRLTQENNQMNVSLSETEKIRIQVQNYRQQIFKLRQQLQRLVGVKSEVQGLKAENEKLLNEVKLKQTELLNQEQLFNKLQESFSNSEQLRKQINDILSIERKEFQATQVQNEGLRLEAREFSEWRIEKDRLFAELRQLRELQGQLQGLRQQNEGLRLEAREFSEWRIEKDRLFAELRQLRELQGQLQGLRQQNEGLRLEAREFSEWRIEKDRLFAELKQLRELQGQLQGLRQQNEELRLKAQEISELRIEKDQLLTELRQIKQLRVQNQRLMMMNQQINEERAQNMRLQKKIAEVQQSQVQLLHSKSQTIALNQKLENLYKENGYLKRQCEQLQKYKQQNQKIYHKNTELTKENNQICYKIRELENLLNSRQAQNEATINDLNHRIHQIQDNRAQVEAQLRNEVNRLIAEKERFLKESDTLKILSQEIDRLRNQINIFERQMQLLTKQNNSLKSTNSQLCQLQEQANRLNSTIVQLHKEISSLQIKGSKTQSQKVEVRQQLLGKYETILRQKEELQLKINELYHQKDSMKLEIDKLNQENKDLRKIIHEAEKLKIDVGRLLQQVEALKTQNNRLRSQDEVSALKGELERANMKIEEFLASNKQKEQILKQLQRVKNDANIFFGQKNMLQQQLDQIVLERDRLYQQNQQLEKETDTLRSKVNRLTTITRQYDSLKLNFNKQIQQLTKENQKLSELTKETAVLHQEVDRLKKLATSNDSLQKQLCNLKLQNQKLSESNNSLQGMSDQLSNLKGEVQRLAQVASEVDRLKQDIEHFIAEGERLLKENEQLTAQDKKLKQELQNKMMYIKQVEQTNRGVISDNQAMFADIQLLKNELNSLTNSEQTNKLKTQISGLIKQLEIEKSEYQTSYNQSLNKIKNLTEQIRNLAGQIKELSKENTELQAQSCSASEVNKQLNQRIQIYRLQSKKITEEKDDLLNQIKSMSQELNHLNLTYEELKRTISQKQIILEQFGQENSRLTQLLKGEEEINKINEQSEAQIEGAFVEQEQQYKRTIEKLEKQILESTNKFQVVLGSLEQADLHINQLKQQIQKEKSENRGLLQKVASQQSNISSQQSQIQKLKIEISSNKETIEKFKSDLSLRMLQYQRKEKQSLTAIAQLEQVFNQLNVGQEMEKVIELEHSHREAVSNIDKRIENERQNIYINIIEEYPSKKDEINQYKPRGMLKNSSSQSLELNVSQSQKSEDILSELNDKLIGVEREKKVKLLHLQQLQLLRQKETKLNDAYDKIRELESKLQLHQQFPISPSKKLSKPLSQSDIQSPVDKIMSFEQIQEREFGEPNKFIKELQLQLRHKEEQLSEQALEKQKAVDTLQQLTNQLTSLKAELIHYDSNAKESIDKTQEQIKQYYESIIKQIETELDCIKTQKNQVSLALQKEIGVRMAREQQYQNLITENIELQAENKRLKRGKSPNKNQSMNSPKQSINRQVQLANQKAELQYQVKLLLNDKEQLIGRIRNLENINNKYQRKINKIQDEKDQLLDESIQHQSKIVALQTSLSRIKETNQQSSSLEDRVAELETIKGQLEQQVKQLQDKNIQMRTLIGEQSEKINQLEKEHVEVTDIAQKIKDNIIRSENLQRINCPEWLSNLIEVISQRVTLLLHQNKDKDIKINQLSQQLQKQLQKQHQQNEQGQRRSRSRSEDKKSSKSSKKSEVVQSEKEKEAEMIQQRYEELLTELINYEKDNQDLKGEVAKLKDEMNYYKNQVSEFSKRIMDSQSNTEDLDASLQNLELLKKLEAAQIELMKLKNSSSYNSCPSDGIEEVLKRTVSKIETIEGNIAHLQSGIDEGSRKIENILIKDEQQNQDHKQKTQQNQKQELQGIFVDREQLINQIAELNQLIQLYHNETRKRKLQYANQLQHLYTEIKELKSIFDALQRQPSDRKRKAQVLQKINLVTAKAAEAIENNNKDYERNQEEGKNIPDRHKLKDEEQINIQIEKIKRKYFERQSELSEALHYYIIKILESKNNQTDQGFLDIVEGLFRTVYETEKHLIKAIEEKDRLVLSHHEMLKKVFEKSCSDDSQDLRQLVEQQKLEKGFPSSKEQK